MRKPGELPPFDAWEAKDESLTPLKGSPFWRKGVLSVFISKLLYKINLADGTLFLKLLTHLFRFNDGIVEAFNGQSLGHFV